VTTIKGRVFDSTHPDEVASFVRELQQQWARPDSTIPRARMLGPGVWSDERAKVQPGPGLRGPLWIGAGRELPAGVTAVGPSVLWDKPGARPEAKDIKWLELEPMPQPDLRPRVSPGGSSRAAKRVFDVVFALAALAVTLPVYPLIMLAIFLEDGRPFFFAHRRESLGGKEFGCLKFRSMRKDAEEIKAKLMTQNQADGPQFFMKNDPRLTKVGRVLRDLQLDELPQFFNVLLGQMSVVGPRPSPYKENQYCPPWREARLSVRPGVTGLWQISRTRADGTDFQEWIKYDLEYVERQSLGFDVWIIWRTVRMILRKVLQT
jgi:lipopolysaccharide/colanic/teichoic acid biosynthesis glycosyltransferase